MIYPDTVALGKFELCFVEEDFDIGDDRTAIVQADR
jgi:hypothetical protein